MTSGPRTGLRALLLPLIAVAVLAGCGGKSAPVKQPPPSRFEQYKAIQCSAIACAVRRQTLMLFARRELYPTVETACTTPQPSLCRILVADEACFAEMANWYGGLELDEWDTVSISPAVCRAVFNKARGA